MSRYLYTYTFHSLLLSFSYYIFAVLVFFFFVFFSFFCFFFFQAEDGIRDHCVTGVQTCALPISGPAPAASPIMDIMTTSHFPVPGDPSAWRGSYQRSLRWRAARASSSRRTGVVSGASCRRSGSSRASRAEIGRASCRDSVESSGV